MRLRWWETVALLVPVVFGVLFLVAHAWLAGVVLIALAGVGAASRARIVERNVAGHHARVRGLLLAVRWLLLLAIYVALTIALFVMLHQRWTSDTHGTVAFYACGAILLYLARDLWRGGDVAINWLVGSEVESEVGVALDRLRDDGFEVVHNVDRDGCGNVDHFVRGRTGAYAIETKSRRHRAVDRAQAVSNAVWAKEKFGARWVTPVLCVAIDPPAEPRAERHGNAQVWVMGRDSLREWILAHPQRRSA